MKNAEIDVQLRGVKKVFQMGEVEVPVLHGIDLDIYRGELLVILGASGSGKSTLLNLIGGLDRPTQGEILFDGHSLNQFDDWQLTEYRRDHVGFVFQFYNLVGTLTAKENVQVSTEIATNPIDSVEALQRVELGDYIDHFPSQLSGGQQQRIAVARALAKRPRLLLCDEPTGALDSKTGQMVLQLLAKFNEELNTTILIITHSSLISHLADRVVYLKNGLVDQIKVNDERMKVEEISW